MDPANNSNLTTENMDPVPAYNPTPIVVPPPPPVPQIPQAQVLSSGGGGGKPKVKWGKGVLVGSIFALVVLVVGLGFGVWQVKRSQNIKNSKANYCAICSPQGTCECINGQQNGSRCNSAPPECSNLGYTWQPDTSTCAIGATCGGDGNPGNGNAIVSYFCSTCQPGGICQENFTMGNSGIGNPCSQVDEVTSTGGFVRTIQWCTASCTGTSPTPTPTPTPTTVPTPTPTPTPTPVPGSACQRIDILRNGIVITQSQVQIGDQIIFRGFASAVNTTVTAINFAVSQNGVITSYAGTGLQLVSGLWQANSPTITIVAASYSVTATPVYP